MVHVMEKLLLESGSSEKALRGPESGDLVLVAPFEEGTLMAVVDGLGHGHEAALASAAAAEILRQHAGENVEALLLLCHEALHQTRGAVMSLASFDARTCRLSWAGVGNVAGILLRADALSKPLREAILPGNGVIGYQMPKLRSRDLSPAQGDILILASDGIRPGFETGLNLGESPKEMAAGILKRHGSGADDASVLVARFSGVEP